MLYVVWFYLFVFTCILFTNVVSLLGYYSSSEGWVGGLLELSVETVGGLGEPLPAYALGWRCSDFVRAHRTQFLLEGRVIKCCTW